MKGWLKLAPKVAQKLPCDKKIDLLTVEWLLNLNIFTWARCFIINELTGSFIVEFVSNKAEGQISKRVLQEDRARQIFRKTNIFYPLIPHYIITTPMIKIFLYFNEDLNKGRYMQVSPAFAFPYNKNINRKFMIIVSNIRNWCQKKLKTRTLRLETSF